jgi:hypothetical protein
MLSGANPFEISDIEKMSIGAHQPGAPGRNIVTCLWVARKNNSPATGRPLENKVAECWACNPHRRRRGHGSAAKWNLRRYNTTHLTGLVTTPSARTTQHFPSGTSNAAPRGRCPKTHPVGAQENRAFHHVCFAPEPDSALVSSGFERFYREDRSVMQVRTA